MFDHSIYCSSAGLLVYGLLTSGDVYIWEKDSNIMYTIEGIAAFRSLSSRMYIQFTKLFIWTISGVIWLAC